MIDNKVSNIRRIIYVDASFNNKTKKSKISLYDRKIDKLETLLLDRPTNISEAEQYAIVYAFLYSELNNMNGEKVHILNDNSGAVQNKKILNICKKFNITLSWIPREINEIADSGTKMDDNISIKDVNIFNLFYDLLIKKCTFNTSDIVSPNSNKNIEDIDKVKNILINAIKHSKTEGTELVSISQVGKYIKSNNESYKYPSLKKEIEKYPSDFIIMKANYVKLLK
jgi:hypothetical protein